MAMARRRCALCQQFYGSGFLDNVAAGELLRARRMLMERSSEDDAPSSRLVREAFDQFLTDMTREREALDICQRNMPLDVCVFCVQFLPSTYDVSSDDEGEARAARLTSTPSYLPTRRCSAAAQGRSSLVIQHQFPPHRGSRAALDQTLQTPRAVARSRRPQSCSRPPIDPEVSASPRPAPTYRLLSHDATRVLRIESPAIALSSVTTVRPRVQSNEYEQRLAATIVMNNLRVQEQQQAAAIFRAENNKREGYYRQRVAEASAAQKTAYQNGECMTGGTAPGSAMQHQNFHHTLANGAETLYTGVVVARQKNTSPKPGLGTTMGAKIVTKKHARHFKTELLFPAIPTASTRATLN